MPPADRALILDFLTAAYVRLEGGTRSEANRRSWRLLGGLLDLDHDALREVIGVCAQADWWGEEMRFRSRRVRHVVSRYYTVCARAQLLAYPQSEALPEQLPGTDGARRIPFEETAATGHREAGQFGLLDAWLDSGRALSEFLELWEPVERR
ncbi:MAG TPA: hypothetical protein VFE20_06625 [Thermoleophilia bacterium]|nr:hypothetical protein [Thermoleophilia bacterium]